MRTFSCAHECRCECLCAIGCRNVYAKVLLISHICTRAGATENPRKLTLCFFRIECEEAQEDQEEDEDPNDLPVQGPLPQEPEDAPWKRNDSGVRRL